MVSCHEKKKSNGITINIIEHDTISKTTSTYLDGKYELIGTTDNLDGIILDQNTHQKITGRFGFGIMEIGKNQNKAFLYITDYRENFDSLPELSNPTDFSLLNEFEISTNEKQLNSVLIEKDEDALTNVKAYKIAFAFIKNEKDTVGFQTTYQLVVNNQFCSINYLNESKENFIEMEKEFEGLALRIK